jgi:hypothetical protein
VVEPFLVLLDPRAFEDEFRRVAVPPGEHFFGNNVSFFSHSAGEEFGRFENRRANFLEVVGAEDIAHHGLDVVPQRRIRRQKIARPSWCFNHRDYLLDSMFHSCYSLFQ